MIKYVSFDVYDTLIKRVVPINEIYNLMEKDTKIENFKNKRIEAEKVARKKYGNNYNIKDIYKCFNDNLLDVDIEKLIKLEKDYEIKNSVINKDGLYLYNKYKDKYKIICISDMFLDKSTIKKILKNNGYNINKIYVSSEEKMSKRKFDLYTKVLKDLNINRSNLLHIGDAKRSDYLNPKLLGIKSILIKNQSIDNYYYNLGFDLFGPLMYEFCRFIKDNINDNNILFVSREGEFFKRCFNTLYPNINTNMIYLSRKSVLSSVSSLLLKNMSFKELEQYVSVRRNETVLDFLKRLGIDIDKYKIEKDMLLSKVDLDLLLSKYKNSIINDLENNNKLFRKYLDNHLKNKNILIDIGWKGSMQDLLSKYLELSNSKYKIRGLYLGIMDSVNKKGFLFDENNDICQNILNYSGILEIIFMPEYGSVIGYDEKNKEVIPVFDKCEFSLESLKIIKSIQSGIIDYLKKMILFDNKLEINKDLIIRNLNKFGNNPSLKDIKYLKNLDFYDNGRRQHLIEKVSFGNLKTSFLNTKWKTGYLKQLFKIKFPYNKLVIYLRKRVDNNGKS